MGKNNFIFITGGSRSGKSSHALKLAESLGERRLYIATAQALDAEMAKRIARHRKERGDGWDTAEEPINIVEVIRSATGLSQFTDGAEWSRIIGTVPLEKAGYGGYDVLLIDCLTLWLCNIMHNDESDDKVFEKIEELVEACKKSLTIIIAISNETGSGIMPDNHLSRRFSDLAGMMNQKMAAAAGQVILTVSGIPMTIKGGR